MKKAISILILSLVFVACGQNDAKQKELEQKEAELKAKQNELELKEKQINGDSSKDKTPPSGNLTPDQKILGIRSEFTRINALQLAQTKYSFVCDTDGTITYFTANGKVVKVFIDWGFIGDGFSISEYYFKNDKLIFTYEKYVGGPANGPDKEYEVRTYVDNDKTIKYMEDQKVTACTKCAFNKSSREYKVLAAFGTKNVKPALCN